MTDDDALREVHALSEEIGTGFLRLGVQMGMLKAHERFALEDIDISRLVTAVAATKEKRTMGRLDITVAPTDEDGALKCSTCGRYFIGQMMRIGVPGGHALATYLCSACVEAVHEKGATLEAHEVKKQWVVA